MYITTQSNIIVLSLYNWNINLIIHSHIYKYACILLSSKRVARGYDFCSVISWFAARADLIILIFDAHKLDISDEFKNAIDALKGNDDKIRCILNKADQVDRQKLMRVYGALMWSLGKGTYTKTKLLTYLNCFSLFHSIILF